ncbi:hypothetical protein ALC56_12843 [Trachymyrmex septentrionalis]|uniref:Uncharacterized protein n=1 Tax=Trachymyrmex septentrionalis TaxID=34720 RepID=A0A195EX84_9HYME|nr:hypothetical protein ALC56_12843 [Trachymyrmex septentrionalis]
MLSCYTSLYLLPQLHITKQRRTACSVIIQVELQSLLTRQCYSECRAYTLSTIIGPDNYPGFIRLAPIESQFIASPYSSN